MTSPTLWQEPQTGLEFLLVTAGSFRMGSPDSEAGRLANEGPLHEVTLDSFWLTRTPVTNRQFRLLYPDHDSGHLEGISFNSDDQPVVRVNWQQAMAYIHTLARQTGKPLRLPTEAEWEYAARAGQSWPNPWHDNLSRACDHAKVADQATHDSLGILYHFECQTHFPVTAPVGRFLPNDWGLQDMLGNVWEWVQDWYDEDYYQVSPRHNPGGPADGRTRVARGGGWRSGPVDARHAIRMKFVPTACYQDLGFRLAMTP